MVLEIKEENITEKSTSRKRNSSENDDKKVLEESKQIEG